MRKTIWGAGALLFSAMMLGHAKVASAGYGQAGCGLGSLIIKDNGFMQVFAATTNGTFGSQTFGISTGTSNCTKGGIIAKSKEQEAFFEANYARLQEDMAKGGGEYLAALGDLMGCQSTVQPAIFEVAEASYGDVFPSDATTPVQALYAFKLGLSQDDRLVGACAQL